MNKKALWEATKEPLRWLALAIIPFVITFFAGIDAQWAIMATVVLRFIDKLMHEAGKEISTTRVESRLVKGIVRF